MDPPTTPFVRFQTEAVVHLDEVRDADRALKRALKIAREAFGADEACLATLRPGEGRARIYASLPGGALWKKEPFVPFLEGRRPRLSRTRLFASITRRTRAWGVLALRNRSRRFDRSAVRDAARMGSSLSRIIQRIDDARLAEIRARLDRKMMEQLRPLDLFYQILHGLRTLTRYDHSAAVLIREADSLRFEVVAEQVSWRKAKSQRIGDKLLVEAPALGMLQRGEVLGFARRGERWKEWAGRDEARPLASLVSEEGGDDGKLAAAVLAAPLGTREHTSGILLVAACHPGSLDRYEADRLQRFLPVASVAIRNMGRATSLEEGILEAERRNALATLARGVSHDVNNAFGSVLPLVQQMIEDVRSGHLDPEEILRDLQQVEGSLQVCRRIFGGMLSLAHGAVRTIGEGNLQRAVEGMRAVLESSLQSRGVQLQVELAPDLPFVRGSQSDLEQLILNLTTNARDAMPGGGTLRIHAALEEGAVVVSIEDTGDGIPAEHLSRIKEPFFTTRSQGTGLGLAICRSILWRMRGEMKVESEVGRGTTVRLRLPIAGEERPDEAQNDTTTELEVTR